MSVRVRLSVFGTEYTPLAAAAADAGPEAGAATLAWTGRSRARDAAAATAVALRRALDIGPPDRSRMVITRASPSHARLATHLRRKRRITVYRSSADVRRTSPNRAITLVTELVADIRPH
ncbi:hypothetical protein GCM10020366_18880 [Saccharopolyspora gregorii]|uniref:Uncharacterized protein n=1 Tax=Saccharopolyspora gregorii TaxID=33914 RepID=A0ABP6RLP9_9PSEU